MSRRSASLLLLLLLCSDLAFNVLHILQHTVVPDSSIYYVRIHDYLDIYHFVKLFWIVVLWIYILKLTAYPGYLSWILLFSLLLLDDTLLIHQTLGDRISLKSTTLFQNLSISPRMFQLAFLAFAGFGLLAVVAMVYFRSPVDFRKITNDLALFFVALIFFGLIADFAAVLNLGAAVILGMVIIEDAGEMVIFSIIIWYLFGAALQNGKPDHFLLDPLDTSWGRR